MTYLRLRQQRLRQTRLFLLLRTPGVFLALFLLLLVLDEFFLLLEDLELLLVAGLVVHLELRLVQLYTLSQLASTHSPQYKHIRTRLSGKPQSTASRL